MGSRSNLNQPASAHGRLGLVDERAQLGRRTPDGGDLDLERARPGGALPQLGDQLGHVVSQRHGLGQALLLGLHVA
ncbi:MAG: hypothetical protein IPH44_17725 [Myxococcales bacterium]|nr:hypothetical protein [Myxococcales bacterium]MBK7196748.1 hypothetical protein [Myxococcales bacterium]MBP6843840.1 hypothetical protein [Kofleriaceae bacterium]